MKEFSVTEDNKLKLAEVPGSFRIIDFNALYHGYYPALTFTAAACARDMYYAAGMDEDGVPHLFMSLLGDVFTEVNITVKNGLIPPSAYGNILSILEDVKSGILFLTGENGYLVTLPDCPKCVRARKVSALPLTEGRLDDDMIVLRDISGHEIRRPVYSEAVYRCSFEFAAPHLKQGGIIVDLRAAEERRPVLPRSVSVPEERREEFYSTCPKDTYIFFLCETGIRADEEAREARERGFINSYSLGSPDDIF